MRKNLTPAQRDALASRARAEQELVSEVRRAGYDLQHFALGFAVRGLYAADAAVAAAFGGAGYAKKEGV